MPKLKDYDFSGWATRNNIRCSDGRTIMQDAFAENDGCIVPLVYMHRHDDIEEVLGHCLLENRPEGVYAYGKFNDSQKGQHAKIGVKNGDITGLSIYANNLQQRGGEVYHGVIREVSLVLAGANPGAMILEHSEESETGAFITFVDEDEGLSFGHADEEKEPEKKPEEPKEEKDVADKEKTVKDVFDSMSEEQKNVVYFMIGKALEDAGVNNDDDDEEDEEDEEVEHAMYGGYDDMRQNVFDNTMDESNGGELSHAAMETIIKDGKKYGTLKESFLAHAEEYGIDGLEWLFPEDRNVNGNTPEWIKRDTGWVDAVMKGVHHTPFSRVKSTFANITEDEARAKGYIKGNMKKEEVFSLLKRSTSPQTVYKKQKIDRDDQIDITDFDVVAWLKGEMRLMLDEEIARAVLIGDGRLSSDDDKIHEDNIRPIANDADLFTIKKAVTVGTDADTTAKNFIRAAIKARKDYKGSGNPTLFTTEDMLTDMLLIEDGIGHAMYPTEQALATKLRVSKIVTVPVMENHQVGGKDLMGIIVNMNDYNIGADKGGAVNMFDDFDIDYNQMKYLIETRCSGALVKPYSAIILFKTDVPVSVDGDVKRSKTHYDEVENPTGNPAVQGWYELNGTTGKYFKTTDTTVDSDKTYFVRVSYNAD